MLRAPPLPPLAVALAMSLLLRRSSHTEDRDKEERQEERRHEDKDRRGVTRPELELAYPHTLVDIRAQGLELSLGHPVEQVVDPVGVEGTEEDGDQDSAFQERQRYLEKALIHVSPVHPRGLVHVARDHLQASQEQERHERRRLPHVNEDGRDQQERPVGEYRLADDAYGAGYILDNPDPVLEHQAPHNRRDDRRERPRYQDGGSDQSSAPEGPVHRERYAQAEYELERHADHRKDHGVGESL